MFDSSEDSPEGDETPKSGGMAALALAKVLAQAVATEVTWHGSQYSAGVIEPTDAALRVLGIAVAYVVVGRMVIKPVVNRLSREDRRRGRQIQMSLNRAAQSLEKRAADGRK